MSNWLSEWVRSDFTSAQCVINPSERELALLPLPGCVCDYVLLFSRFFSLFYLINKTVSALESQWKVSAVLSSVLCRKLTVGEEEKKKRTKRRRRKRKRSRKRLLPSFGLRVSAVNLHLWPCLKKKHFSILFSLIALQGGHWRWEEVHVDECIRQTMLSKKNTLPLVLLAKGGKSVYKDFVSVWLARLPPAKKEERERKLARFSLQRASSLLQERFLWTRQTVLTVVSLFFAQCTLNCKCDSTCLRMYVCDYVRPSEECHCP